MNQTQREFPLFTLTTPLYYVNGAPHVGSAYTTMVADAIARFQSLQGSSVLLITGTDEHGQKIQRTAQNEGLAPQEHCDQIAAKYIALWEKLDIQYDRFSRTTAPNHAKIVREFFRRVEEKGDIYLDQQQGHYCVACEEFKDKERELTTEGYCLIHTTVKAEWRDEENYFFRLSNYQQKLEEFYAQNPNFIQPESRRNEVLSFVKQGLQDFSISRLNLDWGFPVPNNPQHTIYVWFDALLGYITALLDPEEEPTLANALSKRWPINLHLIGKDILRFHAVYWPAMLLSAGVSLPQKVFGHGFLTKDGKKMSKTLGNTINPVDLVNRYGADAVRYYFLKEIELGQDGDFNEDRFVKVLNADLANDLGNLLNRTLGMAKKYCDSQVREIEAAEIESAHRLKSLGSTLGDRVAQAYKELNFSRACEEVLALVRGGNKFIDEQAPWSLYKQKKQKEVERVLYAVLESVRLSAYLLSPIIPNLSGKVYQQLGFDINFNRQRVARDRAPFSLHSQWGGLSGGFTLSQPSPIFPQLELPVEK